ncbi:MAG: hypothetical protein K2X27_14720, partial [Candidatus Obscuribacterales bacterium]|nr:hypothetical protein [Candidatus Obscuribacterales bacterium]
PELMKNAAMRAELKSRDLPTQPLTNYNGSVLSAISDVVNKAVSTTNSTLTGVLSYMASPLSGLAAGVKMGAQLVKVAENIYQTADKNLTIDKVVGETAEKLKAEYNKLFDDTESNTNKTESKVDFSANIYESGTTHRVSSVDDTSSLPKGALNWLFDKSEKPEEIAISENLFSSSNEKNEKTEISAVPGHVHLEKKDADGKIKTVVDKSDNRTMVIQGKETVIEENGSRIIKGDGYTVTWDKDNKRHVILDNGQEIIRDGQSVKLIDHNGRTNPFEITPHLFSSNDYGLTDENSDLEKRTEEIRARLNDGQTYILAIKGAGTRTIFKDGSTIDVQQNHARVETKDGKVFQLEIKDDKLFLREHGKLTPLDDSQSAIKVEEGKFKIGDLIIDQRKLCIETHKHDKQDTDGPPGYKYDWRSGTQFVKNDEIKPAVEVKVQTDNSTVIKDQEKLIANNNNDSKISITTISPTDSTNPAPKTDTINIDLKTTTIETPKVIDDPNRTTIKETNTVIENDHTVKFNDGPIIHRDGTVELDRDTYITNDLSVHSRDWSSNAGSTKTITESSAQNLASSLSSKALSIYGMAKAGAVRWTEVASLNAALGDVLSLMGSVPAGSPAHAMLQQSYALLVGALSVATPKAQASDKAMEQGFSTAAEINDLQKGRSPEEIEKEKHKN